MANHASAKKRVRRNERRVAVNTARRSRIRVRLLRLLKAKSRPVMQRAHRTL